MKEAARDTYDRAVQVALAAIRGHGLRALMPEKPNAETLLAAMQKKVARGEAVTGPELCALGAAIAAQNTRPRRGRPKGTADTTAQWAFCAAYNAIAGSRLNNYRNSASGHRMTRCDAVAEAMNAAKFTTLATYDAAAAELKYWRRSNKRTEKFAHALGEAMNSAKHSSPATYDAAAAELKSWRRSSKCTDKISQVLAEAMNKAKHSSPATYDAAAAELKSRRRSSKRTDKILQLLAEAMNKAKHSSPATYDASVAGLGSIWRSFRRRAEIANDAMAAESRPLGLPAPSTPDSVPRRSLIAAVNS